jgi:hypothetical protein
MHEARTLARFAIGVAAAFTAAVFALPASASTPRTTQGQPSSAAVAAWISSYRAQERAYKAELARARQTSLPSPAAIQAWSDSYRAKADVYQRQQLAQAQREAGAFHIDDAVIGGGIVLAVAALAAAGFVTLRSRRLDAAPLS